MAIHWYRRAAEQGHPKAQYRLANAYYYERGVSKEIAKAVDWCREAVEQGEVEAQFRLGNQHYRGEGVSKDLGQAEHWYRRAAQQENRLAERQMLRIVKEHDPASI